MKGTAVPDRQDQCGSIGDFGLGAAKNPEKLSGY